MGFIIVGDIVLVFGVCYGAMPRVALVTPWASTVSTIICKISTEMFGFGLDIMYDREWSRGNSNTLVWELLAISKVLVFPLELKSHQDL